MTRFRTVLFWAHLATGLTAGAVVLVMSVTGVLLTYEKQMLWWADTRNLTLSEPGTAPRLPLETLLERVRAAHPTAELATVTVRSDASAPVVVAGGGTTLFIDPISGAVVGTGHAGARRFFRLVTDWHRWLGASGGQRAVGRAITGACNLAFLFLVLSGAYLWLPRRWNWAAVRQVLWFRRSLAPRARDFNWHNVIGVWCVLPLALIVASGVVISYPWASNLVYRLAGEAPPARPGGAGSPAGPQAGTGRAQPGRGAGPAPVAAGDASRSVEAGAIGPYFERAARQVPEWRTISLRLPARPDAPLAFTIDAGTAGQPQKRGTLMLPRQPGAPERWEPFASQTRGRQVRAFLRFAHTGEVAGLAGQTLAGLVSLGAVVLVYSGMALSIRRLAAWRRRRSGAASVNAAAA